MGDALSLCAPEKQYAAEYGQKWAKCVVKLRKVLRTTMSAVSPKQQCYAMIQCRVWPLSSSLISWKSAVL